MGLTLKRYYLAKPAGQDLDTREPSSPQVSRENAAASSSTGYGSASTNFLSILCPLLRLFSVSLSVLEYLFPF